MWSDSLYQLAHLIRERHVIEPLQLMAAAYMCLDAALRAQTAGLYSAAARLSGAAAELKAMAESSVSVSRLQEIAITVSLVAGSISGALNARRAS